MPGAQPVPDFRFHLSLGRMCGGAGRPRGGGAWLRQSRRRLLSVLGERFGRRICPRITYLDREGDVITISTDAELKEAFALGVANIEVVAQPLGWRRLEVLPSPCPLKSLRRKQVRPQVLVRSPALICMRCVVHPFRALAGLQTRPAHLILPDLRRQISLDLCCHSAVSCEYRIASLQQTRSLCKPAADAELADRQPYAGQAAWLMVATAFV